ncbi:flagellin [Desulfuribacillus alkaliarsenatis]|uniref:Flagellin n=1 Tax=Desulfuribacillus alkaliarsenatis TaxID=766136 RepID=A0A1E5G3X3_9FIRM|nr:flagellin [Desulfuribacillus alkaliarsenatis]OEF97729.1 flagellin [Desulfuribacillus alkaliarsenatis]
MINVQGFSNGFGLEQQKAMLRMSTGTKINQAADNAAGLAISEKLRGQIRGESMATRNMADSQSLVRTAEGALNQTHSALQRMRELSVQANNGMLTNSDRQALQQEFSQLRDTVDAIGRDTQFNTQSLLDGSAELLNTTTNANGEGLEISIGNALSEQLGNITTGSSLAEVDLVSNPRASLRIIDEAISQISGNRANLGAIDNRLDISMNNSREAELNQAAADSRLRDADIAKSAMELQKFQIMQQTYFSTQRMNMGIMASSIDLLR